ncbi:MAG: hypothetical protein I3274_06950 [Candidatus Moeniiplasma glomeromycotorum]|nr:hypothetical protein [Candidatus Moeniiplasma glomeromycotorum]MCE8168212.1 hypothetical protein [Candidatus Moeniiplasma glomeromycotorum]
MAQTGKLYKFYFRKIWQKNWLRIIIFTLLIGVVWWFVIPWAGTKALKEIGGGARNLTEEQKKKQEKLNSFSEFARTFGFGGKTEFGVEWDKERKWARELLEQEEKWKEYIENHPSDAANIKAFRYGLKSIDAGSIFGISFPFTSDNAFFFSQTEGYNRPAEKPFWKMLFDISWWNLSGFIILYWFIFEVFDKTFFTPREDGEEFMVLTSTPGVKRSDIIWGKTLAFLTFYFLINIALFLIPFGIYYWWLGSHTSIAWFALLALITCLIGPLLFFGLIFTPYLIFDAWFGNKWIFSTFVAFLPFIWGGIKIFSAAVWPYTVEKAFFDPVWFSIISLVVGIFFFILYHLHYSEKDLG